MLAASNAAKDKLIALTKTLAATLGAFAVLLGILVSTLISRGISRSVGATSVAIKTIVEEDIASLALSLGHLAGGDLTAQRLLNCTAMRRRSS